MKTRSPRRGHRALVRGLGLTLGLIPALTLVPWTGGPSPASAQVAGSAAEAAPAVIQRAIESRSKGADSAAVVVFEIADFQCPYCADFAATVAPELDERYVATGQVQWVFVNLPLHTHPRAWHAAEAALCAGVAGDRFWEMHDTLFARQSDWGSADDPAARFAAYAAELDVPADPYARCVDEDQVAALILQDLGSVVSAGISGTPTFIIMKDDQVVERLVGVQPVEDWAEILDGAVK
jgi:protein-disulfide isomerase